MCHTREAEHAPCLSGPVFPDEPSPHLPGWTGKLSKLRQASSVSVSPCPSSTSYTKSA